MKQLFKKPSYYLISSAMDGNEKAIEKLLAFYDPYISKCCLRSLYDEYGNVYIVVDMELKGRIREALICKLRSNGMPVPLLRNGYSIFNGTKYR